MFDPDWFTLYLAAVAQTDVFGPVDQLGKQAIPEKTTVEGVIYYNITKAVSNAKDLLVRYQPNEDYSIDETVFEFKINEYKRIRSAEDVVNEPNPNQTVQKTPAVTSGIIPATELTQDEIYSAIEDAYYNDLQKDYYNDSENFYEDTYEDEYDYGEGIPYVDPWMNQLEVEIAEQEWIDDFSVK